MQSTQQVKLVEINGIPAWNRPCQSSKPARVLKIQPGIAINRPICLCMTAPLQELSAQHLSPRWKQDGQRGREIKRIADDDGEWC